MITPSNTLPFAIGGTAQDEPKADGFRLRAGDDGQTPFAQTLQTSMQYTKSEKTLRPQNEPKSDDSVNDAASVEDAVPQGDTPAENTDTPKAKQNEAHKAETAVRSEPALNAGQIVTAASLTAPAPQTPAASASPASPTSPTPTTAAAQTVAAPQTPAHLSPNAPVDSYAVINPTAPGAAAPPNEAPAAPTKGPTANTTLTAAPNTAAATKAAASTVPSAANTVQNAEPSAAALPITDVTSKTEPNASDTSHKPDASQTSEHLARLQTVGTIPETSGIAAPKTTESASVPAAAKLPITAQPVKITDSTPLAAAFSDATASAFAADANSLLDTLLAAPFALTGTTASGNPSAASALTGKAASEAAASGTTIPAASSSLSVTPAAAGARHETGTETGTQSSQENRDSDSAPAKTDSLNNARPELQSAAKADTGTSAVGGAKDATASGTLDRAKLVAQVTKHLETMRLTGGRGETSFRLEPDHLGSLRVTISSHANGITARVTAENAPVQQALQGAKEHLRAALETRGLHLDSLEISVGQNAAADGHASYNAPQNGGQERYSSPFLSGAAGSASRENAVSANAPTAVLAADRLSRLDYRA